MGDQAAAASGGSAFAASRELERDGLRDGHLDFYTYLTPILDEHDEQYVFFLQKQVSNGFYL